jgi:hypothetical protein
MTVAFEDSTGSTSSIGLTVSSSIAEERPLLLCLISRPDAVEQIDAIAPDRTTVVLEPLAKADPRGVESVLEGTAPRELVAIVERSENPFFIEETVRSMREGGARPRRRRLADPTGMGCAHGSGDGRGIPARFDLFLRSAAALVQTASVIGRRAAPCSCTP